MYVSAGYPIYSHRSMSVQSDELSACNESVLLWSEKAENSNNYVIMLYCHGVVQIALCICKISTEGNKLNSLNVIIGVIRKI